MNEQDEMGDPDYQIPAIAKEQKRIRDEHEKTQMVLKIRDIIKKEFERELNCREKQMELIQQRLNKAAKTLHLLRYCLITTYYNKAELQVNNIEDDLPSFDPQSRIHPALRKLLSTSPGSVYNNIGLRKKKRVEKIMENQVTSETTEELTTETDQEITQGNKIISPKNATVIRNRKLYKHQILVGNISKFAPSESTEDSSTHKWMVYVRGPKEFPDISHIVEKVVFYLHPSYKPNDVIEICKSPFHLSRRGWGEFPLRIQLFFHGKLNKPVDIIHNLKLDRTYTGRQTLGNETLVEVSLYDINKTEGQVKKNGFTNTQIAASTYIGNTTLPKPETAVKEPNEQESETTINAFRSSIRLDHTYCQTNEYDGKEFVQNSHDIDQLSTETNNGQGLVMKKRKFIEQSLLNSSSNKRIKTEIIEDNTCEALDINKYIINVNSFRLKSLDEALKVLFKKLPLVCDLAAHSNYKCLYPFTASSAIEFAGWNTAKQFASEWARARLILKLLHTSQFGRYGVLTTKRVLLYGRVYGFTPTTKYSIYKSIHGSETNFNFDRYQSNLVNRQPPDQEDVNVNIMDCDVDNVRKEESLLVTWTDNFKYERSFVKQAALDVGVVLKKDQIVPGVMYNTSERIIFECVKSFAEDLIRQSLAKAAEQETFYEGSILNPTHVVEGLHHRAEFEKILSFNKDTLQY